MPGLSWGSQGSGTEESLLGTEAEERKVKDPGLVTTPNTQPEQGHVQLP